MIPGPMPKHAASAAVMLIADMIDASSDARPLCFQVARVMLATSSTVRPAYLETIVGPAMGGCG